MSWETVTGWDRVIGQERVVETLRRGVAGGRVPQAYLFHGPPGSGKRVAALALAQVLLCAERPAGSAEACGRCSACRRVPRLIHPDAPVHLPEPKEVAPAEVGKRLQRLAENPYAEVDFARRPDLDNPDKAAGKAALYTVDRMRDIGIVLRRVPTEGRMRVVVFCDADAMNVQAANAFLKGLEEPTAASVLVLTTTRVDALLPTIVSRCQRLRFDPLAPEAIEAALLSREGLDAARASLVARMADGSYTRALELATSSTLTERRDEVIRLLRHLHPAPSLELDDFLEALARQGREPVREFLRTLVIFLRDLLLARELGEAAPLVNLDQAETVHRFVRNVPDARLGAMAELAEEALALVGRNVSVPLILIVLGLQLRRAMHGRPAERLAAELAEPLVS